MGRPGGKILAVIAGLVVGLAFLIWTVSLVADWKIAMEKPPTPEELATASERIATAAQPVAEVTSSAAETTEAAALPGHFEHAVPREVLVMRYVAPEGSPAEWEARWQDRLTPIMVPIVGGLGLEDVSQADHHRARGLMRLGRWEEARGWCWRYLKTGTDPKKLAEVCVYLAWMEEDPQKAHDYLRMADHGDDEWFLPQAYTLCVKTGSDVLAEYYLERQAAIDPERARELKEARRGIVRQ